MAKILHLPTIFLMFGLISILQATIKFSYNESPYRTHQPILYEIATNTNGPIIEFECGNGITAMLHEICESSGRLLISLDDNLEWINKFRQRHLGNGYTEDNTGWHKFYFVPGKKDDLDPSHWVKFFENFQLLQPINFDVCFIDQSPWLARHETIKRIEKINLDI